MTSPAPTLSKKRLPDDWHLAGFDHQPKTRLIFGNRSLEQLGTIARQLNGSRVLLVTDKGIVEAGHAEKAVRFLESAGMQVALFGEVQENPTTGDVDRCLEVAKKHQTDLIVGLGGGSSMDTAKGTNFLLTNGGRMKDYWGVDKAKHPMLPLIAIPTTAGTGSECQCAALIAEETSHLKMACLDKKAAAKVAILDPELTVSQPRMVTADTGIDAIAHAVETAVCTRRNGYSLMFSNEAFKMLVPSLPRVLARPDDLEARGRMLLGAAFAGTAIENSMLGAAHSAANPLTAHYNVVHGQAVGPGGFGQTRLCGAGIRSGDSLCQRRARRGGGGAHRSDRVAAEHCRNAPKPGGVRGSKRNHSRTGPGGGTTMDGRIQSSSP